MEDSPISKGQLRRIQTLWGIHWAHTYQPDDEVESRCVRLQWISVKIGRQIQSCKDLTRAEAKMAIDAIQKLLPPDLVRPPKGSDRSHAKDLGTAGRRGHQSKTVRLPDAQTFALLEKLLAELSWDRAGLDRFLHSPKSPVRGAIRTLGDANKIIWVLKGMLRRREKRSNESLHDRSDGGNGSANPAALP